jgi:uncharacterized protein with FMN-binding domain
VRGRASIANPPSPAAVFTAAADILPEAIVPAAAADPAAVAGAYVTPRAVVVAIARIVSRSVIGTRDS